MFGELQLKGLICRFEVVVTPRDVRGGNRREERKCFDKDEPVDIGHCFEN